MEDSLGGRIKLLGKADSDFYFRKRQYRPNQDSQYLDSGSGADVYLFCDIDQVTFSLWIWVSLSGKWELESMNNYILFSPNIGECYS